MVNFDFTVDPTIDMKYHLEELKMDISAFKLHNSKIAGVFPFCNTILQRMEIIEKLIDIEPRFDWVKIQNIIDESFKEDNNLTGASIDLDWTEGSLDNRVRIKENVSRREASNE